MHFFHRQNEYRFKPWPGYISQLEVTKNLENGHLTIPKTLQRLARYEYLCLKCFFFFQIFITEMLDVISIGVFSILCFQFQQRSLLKVWFAHILQGPSLDNLAAHRFELICCVQVNLYDVLGVEKNASEQEIKKALAMLGHEEKSDRIRGQTFTPWKFNVAPWKYTILKGK